MSHEVPEVLSAFVDGESVDPRELAEALQAPGALDSLRQFVELRAGVREMQDRPGDEFYAAMEQVVAPSGDRRPWWRRVVPVPLPALAAAAVAAIALVAWLVPLGPSTVDLAAGPPQPDRFVRFEPGVDWHYQDGNPQALHRRIEDEELDESNDPDRNDRDAFVLAGRIDLAPGLFAVVRKRDAEPFERRRWNDRRG